MSNSNKTFSLRPLVRALVFGGALAFTAPSLLAATLPTGVTQAMTVEGITEYRLPNGLRVLLMPDESKPTVTVNITYLVGSRHENYGETGMAHLLEHMVFKGTPKNPAIDVEFNKRGMRINGTTNVDRTNYFELFQASDENLKWAIELEADRMVNSNISKADLDKEMTVVRNEYERGENNPIGVLFKRLLSVAFDWHNYGNSTIGNRSDIENVKIENLQAFYRMYYQPDNAVLTIAGKFDPEKTLKWVNDAFSKIPKPKRKLPDLWTVEPTQDGERFFTVRRPGDIQGVIVGFKIPSELHEDREAVSAALQILTNTPNGRLHKQLVEKSKAVQVLSVSMGSADSGLAVLGAIVKKGEDVDAAKTALLAAIEDFKTNPPTQEELDRVKRDSANRREKIMSNHESFGIAISEYIAAGDWRLFFQEQEDIEKLTPEKVHAAFNKYYVRDNRTVGMFVPEDKPMRAEVPVGKSATEILKDFKPKATAAVSEAFDPNPANIEKRTQISQIGGVKVALLQKKNRGETVNVSLDMHWGDEKSLFGKRTLSSVVSGLIGTGTSRFTRAQIADEMSKLKMSGGIYNFQTTKENLPKALALVSHILRDANFTENEFKQAIERGIVGLEASRSEPGSVAARAMSQHFNRYTKGDYRANSTIDESIAELKNVKLDDVKAFHKEFFGASKAELAIVGDLDADAVKQVVEKEFATWKSNASYARLTRQNFDVDAVRKVFHTPEKSSANYVARLNFAMREDNPDYPALVIANYMFGGGAGMNSRILERIRQKDGLSYGGGSGISVGTFEPVASFSLQATAAPENMAKLEAAIHEELNRSLKDGFTAEELAKAKSGYIQKSVQSRTSDGNLAGTIAENLYLNRTWAHHQDLDEKVKKLTVEQVNSAWRKYIDPSKMSIFMAGDDTKMKLNK